MAEIKLIVHPFEMGTPKEAALKPLEEAAEVYAAWQRVDECSNPEYCNVCGIRCRAIINLEDELSDCITACGNFANRYNINLQAAMERCEERNRARGRY